LPKVFVFFVTPTDANTPCLPVPQVVEKAHGVVAPVLMEISQKHASTSLALLRDCFLCYSMLLSSHKAAILVASTACASARKAILAHSEHKEGAPLVANLLQFLARLFLFPRAAAEGMMSSPLLPTLMTQLKSYEVTVVNGVLDVLYCAAISLNKVKKVLKYQAVDELKHCRKRWKKDDPNTAALCDKVISVIKSPKQDIAVVENARALKMATTYHVEAARWYENKSLAKEGKGTFPLRVRNELCRGIVCHWHTGTRVSDVCLQVRRDLKRITWANLNNMHHKQSVAIRKILHIGKGKCTNVLLGPNIKKLPGVYKKAKHQWKERCFGIFAEKLEASFECADKETRDRFVLCLLQLCNWARPEGAIPLSASWTNPKLAARGGSTLALFGLGSSATRLKTDSKLNLGVDSKKLGKSTLSFVTNLK
jgi:hypothetical protein